MAKEIGLYSRVWVFDHRLYGDDVSTPLSVTMKKATVVDIYKEKGGLKFSHIVADVEFDYRPNEISKAHFVNMIDEIDDESQQIYEKVEE